MLPQNPDNTFMQFISIIIIILEPSTAPGLDIEYSDDWFTLCSNLGKLVALTEISNQYWIANCCQKRSNGS